MLLQRPHQPHLGLGAARQPLACAHSPRSCSQLPRQPRRAPHVRAARSGASSSGNGASSGSEEDGATDHQRELQRCNSLQQSFVRRDKSSTTGPLESICCFMQDDLPKHHTSRRGVTNQVQLSTYADCIGSDLTDLTDFLRTHIRDAIGSVHVLPLYPSTGDRGFAPVNYQEVDPTFGTWANVRELADEYQLCLEYMCNHISPASPEFQDYVAKGDASAYTDMFVKWGKVWPGGKPSAEQLAQVRTRKPAPPVLVVHMADGSVVPLWCTFSDQQIDIDPFSTEGWRFTEASLRSLCKHGAKLIRLDAFGYVTKKAGTTCFMQEPEVWDLLERIKRLVKPFGVQLLCEVHEDFNLNIELARHGFWVYDFALPLLLVHALRFKTADALKNWLSICPRRQITTLDTHDGMGVDDVTGLAPLVDVKEIERCILDIGGTINYKHFYRLPRDEDEGTETEDEGGAPVCSVSSASSLQAAKDFLQPDCLKGCYVSVEHQYNATYFSALHEDPQAYLLARAVQFFTPGVPMVYYVGLLAGVNDYELLAKGGIRDINRHYYTLEEAEQAVQQPVVQALLKLCRFRNFHPAFKGRVFIDDQTPSHMLRAVWYLGDRHVAVLEADFEASTFSIRHTPYRLPSEAGVGGDDYEEEFHSDFSLDVADVFSIDAMDLTTRAAVRTSLVTDRAESGVVASQHYLNAMMGGGGSASESDTGVGEAGSAASSAGSGSWASAGGRLGDTWEQQQEEARDQAMARGACEWDLQQLDLSFAWTGGDKAREEGAAAARDGAEQQVGARAR